MTIVPDQGPAESRRLPPGPAELEFELQLARAHCARLEAALQAREAELAQLVASARSESETQDAATLRRDVKRLRGRLDVGEEESAAARREIARLQQAEEALAVATARADRAVERQSALAKELDAVRAAPAPVAAVAPTFQGNVDTYRDRVRELEQLTSALSVGLAATKADIARAEASRAWRYGHGFTKLLSRLAGRKPRTDGALARALQRIEQVEQATRALPAVAGAPTPTARDLVAPPKEIARPPVNPHDIEALRAARAELAREVRARLGPTPDRDEWPAVSIVVVNRNGRPHLEWLLDGLEHHTAYPQFELVVVDNDSSDESVAFLDTASARPFDVVVERSDTNLSYSAANNKGIARASHDLVLLLNNDVEPFEEGWLRELVAALDGDGVVAIGATLLHVESVSPEITVQHRAVGLMVDGGLVRAVNAGDGDGLFGDHFGMEQRAPAVTAACLLIAKATLDRVGGLHEAYRYGTEDVDLGLTLSAAGDVVLGSGRALLFHRESSTQRAEGRDFMRVNREVNRRVLHERWGPRLRREYRLARIERDPDWTDGRGPHVAITVTSLDVADGWGDWYTAHEMGDALEALGWRVTYVARKGDGWLRLPPDLDHLLSLMDVFDLRGVPDDVLVTIWVRNWTQRWLEREWFDRADIILASSKGSADLIERRSGRPTVRFPLAANPARFAAGASDPDIASDYVFSGNHWGKERAIEQALEPSAGEQLAIYGRDWDKVKRLKRYDRGVADYDRLPAIYASAKLVLDDTQGPTLPYGAVNCRVFDALAAGTLVVTNCEAGVRELFDDEFPVWSSKETLREQLDTLLGDDARREALARRYRQQVLTAHTYAHRAHRLVEVVREAEEQLSFCIKIGAPDAAQAERWGDLHFARAIRKQLRRRGNRCRIQTLDRWELLDGVCDDVVVHLKGLSRYHPKPGQFNVLWCISHPDEISGEECDGYDLVCVASAPFAAELANRTRTPVIVMEQATDPDVFFPDFDPDWARELVYVANSRNVLRPIVRDLLPTKRDLAIWGANWAGLVDSKYVVGEHVPNDELRKVYSSATIVLADHWDDMREHGFIANRIYDALACGATVVSDDVLGLRERFGGGVRTYSSPAELLATIEELTGSSLTRLAMGARGRDRVLEGGTFDQRVAELMAAVTAGRKQAGVRDRVRAVST
jgi:GT2 family glycosyltransferase/spore maturation protein CgeB